MSVKRYEPIRCGLHGHEVYELTTTVTPAKILNLLVVYLLFAERLFGLCGGGRAEQAEYDHDTGWAALGRTPALTR